jgi:hypothetical protein
MKAKLEEPDETRALTIDEAANLPGILGRIAPCKLRLTGEYGYREAETGRKILIVRKLEAK